MYHFPNILMYDRGRPAAGHDANGPMVDHAWQVGAMGSDGTALAWGGGGLDLSTIGDTSYSRAADAIRRDIIHGRLVDGQRLVTTDLAKRYGLSLAPIREALQLLSAEGIVMLQPKHGAVARAVTPAFLTEIYEVRLGLIPYLEGERARMATDEDVRRMSEIEAAYEAAAAAEARDDIIALNIEFHHAALSVRVNHQAHNILQRHHTLIRELRMRYGFGRPRLEEAVEEHRGIIDAFRRRSSADAQAVSRAHLMHAFEELLDLYRP
jgi:DNA-binding GntR family transcriptional regulator